MERRAFLVKLRPSRNLVPNTGESDPADTVGNGKLLSRALVEAAKRCSICIDVLGDSAGPRPDLWRVLTVGKQGKPSDSPIHILQPFGKPQALEV